MILDANGMPVLQPLVDDASTATFNTAFAAIGTAQVAAVARRRWFSGTATQRAAWVTGGNAAEGDHWQDTDGIKGEYAYRSSAWVREPIITRGIFNGATDAFGVATISHGMRTTPTDGFAQNWNSGAVPGTRQIVTSAISSTQIQFVVYNGAGVLGSNPVVFSWMAIG